MTCTVLALVMAYTVMAITIVSCAHTAPCMRSIMVHATMHAMHARLHMVHATCAMRCAQCVPMRCTCTCKRTYHTMQHAHHAAGAKIQITDSPCLDRPGISEQRPPQLLAQCCSTARARKRLSGRKLSARSGWSQESLVCRETAKSGRGTLYSCAKKGRTKQRGPGTLPLPRQSTVRRS